MRVESLEKKQKGVIPRRIMPPFVFTPTPIVLIVLFMQLVWGFLPVYAEPSNKLTDIEYHNLATQSAERQNWQDAINYEQKACETNPTNSEYFKQLAIYHNNYALIIFGNDRYDLAIANFKEALKFDPSNNTIKDNIYNTTLEEANAIFKKGRIQEAINLAEDCIGYNSSKPSAYVFLGNIYYQQDNFKAAIKYWEEALSIDPRNPNLKEMLDKAKREFEVEQNFKTRARTHFNVVFEGEKDSELAWDVMDMLEDAMRKVKSDFGFFTDEKITVIIYNTEQFKKVAGNALDWTLGLYDGKIRLKAGDILAKGEDLKKIIYHEYAHAILHILFPKNIPLWLHEGFAQIIEPETALSPQDKNLLNTLKKEGSFKLDKIAILFQSGDYNNIHLVYLESKLFLKYLIDRYGKYKFNVLLEKLNSGIPLEDITYDIYRSHIEGLENDCVKNMP